ncbi:MAG: four-carbon acid sugar kinase family protein [Treponema sp.]|jgi:uncharacterized protein YgbK (DUF1537 family)|nr:four-carbon acid sugar kinase family protein [Treponema sp.]
MAQCDTEILQKKLLILADDLTGALDTGVQFAKRGIETCVYPFFPAVQEPLAQNISVRVINTNSRHASAEEARKIIMAAVSAFKTYSFFYKKTDSCLRGNIGAELEALIHATGSRQLAFIPAYPALKRSTKEGSQCLDGELIHKSDMAKDPQNPITESYIPTIIEKQSAIPVRLIPINGDIPVNSENPASQNTPEIMVFDAERLEHLINIANELLARKMLITSAGCAGFAEALMEVLPLGKKYAAPNTDDYEAINKAESLKNTIKKLPMLIVSGSLHSVSVNQIKAALTKGIPGYSIDGEIMTGSGWNESMAAETLVASCALALEQQGICILGTEAAFGNTSASQDGVTPKAKTANGKADVAIVSDNIANALGKIALKIMQKIGPLHLVVFGGDSLLGIIKALNYNLLIPIKEVLPGIVLSRPAVETGCGLLVSKAGAFGDKDLIHKIEECIGRLD